MRSSVAAGLLAIAFSWPIVIVASGAEKGPEERGPVAATVNGTPIYASEVQEALAPLNAGRDLTAAEKTKLAAEVLERLIDRRLVEAAIRKAELAADDAQVEQALKQLRLGVEADKASWSDYLAGRSQSEASLRRQVAWQLSWQRFLQARLSDAQFEDYFKAHARDFDGTELRVSHLLHGPLPSDPSAVAALVEGARKLRERITAGTPTFEEAVKKYSTGPSREQAGDLGFIPRHGVMAEAFNKAAFALQPGEISPPVVTLFGVHLIKVTEVRPGRRQWTDVRDQLKPPVAQALFDEIAKRERKGAKIVKGAGGAGPER